MNYKTVTVFTFVIAATIWLVGQSCAPEDTSLEYLNHVSYTLMSDGKIIGSDSLLAVDLTFNWDEQGTKIPIYLDGQRNGKLVVIFEMFTEVPGNLPINGVIKPNSARLLYSYDGTFANTIEFDQGNVQLNSVGFETHPNETIKGTYSASRTTDTTTFTMVGSFERRKF